ncbi:MAG: polymerase subunit alpha [Clostridia bacterium]|nr:polymerase subunit alpha [Clostridia bacterium]
MAGKDFVHLHVHSEYSLLDGAGRVEELAAAAAAMGMPALAITDHGVMYGVVDFYKAARDKGIKPLIGCEVYVAPRGRMDKEAHRDDFQYHLVLLVENEEGYRNLCHLVSLAYLEGFYYKPRVDRELLAKFNRGLVALSACLAGEIPTKLLQGQEEAATEAAAWLKEVFADRFYLELQDQGMEEEKRLNPMLVQMSKKMGIPLVVTNDVHYVRREDAKMHDVLLCIQTGKTLTDANRLRFPTPEFYLKNQEEMYALFPEVPEALKNTLAITERCNFNFEFGRLHLPEYSVPAGETTASYLRRLCYEGLQRRFPNPSEKVRQRLEYELSIIEQMGYPGYFLIVWDLVNFARQLGIPVGPGRGSAAGSLVAYCLGITNIDPLRYNLLFERFLNPERVSMPDIDMDFCFERRDEVIRYVFERYGQEHVAQIITFGTMAARGSVRDVGRVMGVPLPEVDRIAKLIPLELGITIDRALEMSVELREMYEGSSQVRELLDTARAVEGMPRHASVHAAGIVITREPLTHYLPLQKTGDAVTTQFPMQTVEELGLLKMDLLGLRTLTVIGDTVKAVNAAYGANLEINAISLEDRETYSLLASGETTGVFQLESSGMRAILRSLQPERFEDIIALVALYRPGPLGSGMVEDFIQRKHGQKQIEYLHPALEPILKDTYGVILYQEQVMRIASELAGFTLGQADLLRRAMGKKKPEVLAGMKSRFLEGAQENGIDLKIAEQIFELMEYFAGYGFNASHSAAYALVAYQTAYLKAHYPAQFLAALLTSVSENLDKLAPYLEECRRLGIRVLPPDVNESGVDFTVTGGHIRYGLAAVKNVGRAAVEHIIAVRQAGGPFRSLLDFCRRVDLRQVNKRVLESLIRCGAFASLGASRKQLYSVLDECLEMAARQQVDLARGQMSLFDEESGVEELELPQVGEYSQSELLAMEKELLGYYLSGHPLDSYAEVLKDGVTHKLSTLADLQDGTEVTIGGLIAGMRRILTRKGEPMAYITLEDFGGQVEVLVFPKTFAASQSLLVPDSVVLISGRIDRAEEEIKVIAEAVTSPGQNFTRERLYLNLNDLQAHVLPQLRGILRRYPGPTPVYFYYAGKYLKAHRDMWIGLNEDLLKDLQAILGDRDRVRVVTVK